MSTFVAEVLSAVFPIDNYQIKIYKSMIAFIFREETFVLKIVD